MNGIGKFKPEKPKKKGRDGEVSQILDYLIKGRDFECPTAQTFYRKLLKRSNIDATWNLLRWKVRNLKVTYKRAESWRNSIDAGLLESSSGPSAVHGGVLKMCPHYVKLKKIFGSQLDDGHGFEAVDVATSDIPDFVDISQTEHATIDDFEFNDNSNQPISDTEESNALTLPVSATSRRETEQITTNSTQIYSTFPLSEYALLQRERTEFEKCRLKFERWKTEQEFELRKEELAVRREELQVKRMEIEKDERVVLYEIQIKYKNKEN